MKAARNLKRGSRAQQIARVSWRVEILRYNRAQRVRQHAAKAFLKTLGAL
ncbi:hypothetical protein [Deinococcus ruber]|uniref:Uncharacterized protein n=1 Tax=Deinococcus ruber TaxID=1848197 RepID=A0A918CMX1_9DEIO|nr:hypothetical protein [Deinococcus ruber]GGR31187.1 hypothetical protein GCM10008957_47300 [Deinococcus ruber]